LCKARSDGPERSGYDRVRQYWEAFYAEMPDPPQPTFEAFWRTALHDGVVAGTTFAPVAVTPVANLAATLPPLTAPAVASGLTLHFAPDPTLWDGRYAHNAWLQELPKPLTTLTWDNPALISPATAQRLGVATGDVVELRAGAQTLRTALFLLPGHPDEAVTLYLGYGATDEAEDAGTSGFRSYALRTTDTFWWGSGVELVATDERYALAAVQNHFALDGRDLVRASTLAHFLSEPNFAQVHHGHDAAAPESSGAGVGEDLTAPSLYPEYPYEGNAWGMVIDMTACIGCNACVIACMVENNIPAVGKDEVLRGHEMHWLKVDQYYEGADLANPTVHFQPRPCMHCEKAPCEPVCPVTATVHDSEGLNKWSTTAVWARATAPIIALTKCVASTSLTIMPTRSRSKRCGVTPM